MMLQIAAYAVLICGCVVCGKRLYGEWAPALALAFISPLVFAIISGFLAIIYFFVLARVGIRLDPENEWARGSAILASALFCSGALFYFAKTEGIPAEKKANKAVDPTPGAAPRNSGGSSEG